VVQADVKAAHDQNAQTCAPRELAVAEANLRFAQLELDQGDSFRADEHMDVAAKSAKAAIAQSRDCGKVTVLIREKEAPAGPPRVALKDTDGDGVPDIDDLCPEVPGPASNHGCPIMTDRDGDGVPDKDDKCPDVPGPVENAGCPWPDRDHDGVLDKDDQCPDEPGPADNHGCPRKQTLIVVRKDRIELRQQVHFRPNRSVILADSFELLRQVAQALKDAPHVNVRVEGHTDNVGKLESNMKLSQARADSVRDFLVRQGVDARQVIAEGYGPTRPIASNLTRAGKAANRRVEFRMIEPTPAPAAAPLAPAPEPGK
jgi:outer membrane protein OmpA-like peptidoglycan-associated protein